MSKHNPNLPTEGRNGGAGDNSQNDSIPAEQRTGARLTELGDGPKLAENGAYLPSSYLVTREVQTPKGDTITTTCIREDR